MKYEWTASGKVAGRLDRPSQHMRNGALWATYVRSQDQINLFTSIVTRQERNEAEVPFVPTFRFHGENWKI